MRSFPGVFKSLLASAVTIGVMGGSLLAAPLNTGAVIEQAPVNIPVTSTRVQLSGVEAATFDILRSQICDIAAGRRTSTALEVPVLSLGLPSLTWTAAELGVDTIVVNGAVTDAAKSAALNKVTGDFNTVLSALLMDCPYELFWFNKANGAGINCGITASYDASRGQYVLSATGSVTYYLDVYPCYSAGPYQVSAAGVSRAQAAAANARAIVSRYAGLSDYDKLVAYRNEICSLVTYNNYASVNTPDYGEAWQLVYVFDGNPSTNVVCEGYAKAFKYLCDLTTFNSSLVSCLIVRGEASANGMGSGGHMWNVVRMDDGANYIVDLTNYDESGFSDPTNLFLGGASGSVGGGYTVTLGSSGATFAYQPFTINFYSDSVLALSGSSYVPVAGGYAQPAPVDVGGASAFIERLYTVALQRESDPVGAQYWLDRVVSGNSTGADLARGFLFSQEFLGKNMSDDDFLTILYRTFFDREADPAGREYWLGKLRSGMSRQDVISGFINSVEWHNLCTSYGIRSGSAAGGYT